MDEQDRLAERFETHRGHLRAVAYRMLGSLGEADDAVQEAWLRLSRGDAERGRESGRLAEDGRLPACAWTCCAPARPDERSRIGQRTRRPDPGRRGGRRGRPRRRSGAGRLGRPRAARGAGHAGPRRADRVRAARHVRRAVRPDRPRSSERSPVATEEARQPCPPQGAAARPRSPPPTSPGSAHVVDAFLAASRGGDMNALLAVLGPGRRAPGRPGRPAAGRGDGGPAVRGRWRRRPLCFGRQGAVRRTGARERRRWAWSWPRAGGCSSPSPSRSRARRITDVRGDRRPGPAPRAGAGRPRRLTQTADADG